MRPIEEVRAAFVDPVEFWSSPLYRHLCTVVAADPHLVRVAAQARAGQVPTFLFLGAVQFLLLGGRSHELADFYPSLREQPRPAEQAGPAFADFVRTFEDEIVDLLRTRLVQTNHVQRALGLRLALALIRPAVGDRPVHLLEIGSSCGLLLRQDRYGYALGGREFGVRSSPVRLAGEWRSTAPVPDLDAVPGIASATGIDLHPLDPAVEGDRRWLRALVWPENAAKATLLAAALDLAATAPVRTIAGDAVDMCPQWIDGVPPGEPRVVFHCATLMHVPRERRALVDTAIARAGADGPLFRVGIERVAPVDDPLLDPADAGVGLEIDGPAGASVPLAVEGHLAWVRPLSGYQAPTSR